MARLTLTTIAVVYILLGLCSCRSSGNKSQKDPFQALNYPPFNDITDSIRRFPGHPEFYLRRAIVLSQNNLQELATPDYKKAWELTSDEGIELEYISNLLLTNHVTQAIQLLMQGTEKFPSNTEFNRRLGEVYLQKNQPDSAMQQFNSIIGKDSTNFEAWYDKGTLLAKLKDTTGALKALEKSFALLPINYSGMALAGIYAAKKNPRALDICNMLLAKDSGAVETAPLYMKGVYYSEAKEYDHAIEQFDLCIRRDWKMTDAYIEKGIIFLQLKRTDSALKIFNMAATVSNTDADAYFWMGRCYEAKGDKQQAAANYDRAFALDKSFIEARQGLERVTK
ncbi:MAG: tetratricopeptide repeat protein [Chitinophagaceae bacterium]|nr:tetratricopeptide repeat protein [Chitinophagaceae bacterium]